jgi:hypothetical protein
MRLLYDDGVTGVMVTLAAFFKSERLKLIKSCAS